MPTKKPGKKIKMQNAGSPEFNAACSKANVQPTMRQWKKFLKREGLAFQNRV